MTEEKKLEKVNNYKQRLYESLLYGRVSEARKYCIKLLDIEPLNKGFRTINSTIEELRLSNGRYHKFNDFASKYLLIDGIIEYEIESGDFVLCNDFYFMQFCFQCVQAHPTYDIFSINKFLRQLNVLEQKLNNGLNQEIIKELKTKRKNAIALIISIGIPFMIGTIFVIMAGLGVIR